MVSLKQIILGVSLITPLTFSHLAYAATVRSDFAQDVQDGTSQLQSDPTARTQADNVKNDEKIEGHVDDGKVEVDETIGDQEGDMDGAHSGESHDTSDHIDEGTTDNSDISPPQTDNGGSH